MTYCVAIAVDAGMVFCSDSRTNAGIDQVSTYGKMYRFGVEGQRQFVILTAGNLATTQATIAQVKRDIKERAKVSLLTAETVSDAADYLGDVSLTQQEKHAKLGNTFEASFIIGGQIANSKHRIMLVYPQGNHITSSKDTPYLQIGESKYGKPILDRVIQPGISMSQAIKCALVSFDSTIKSNLSVGLPIDIAMIKTNDLQVTKRHRIDSEEAYFRDLRSSWSQGLRQVFGQLPDPDWLK